MQAGASAYPELRPIEPMRALAALARLRANPDDTMHVFTIIEALSGQAPLRALARMHAHPGGKRLFAERPELLQVLLDREALVRMPRGSLAHAYLAFVDSENITADGLVRASLEGSKYIFSGHSDLTYFRDRMRDSHDLWHTVTGYQGDVIGEIALLAFNLAQLKNPGVGLVVAGGLAELRDGRVAKLAARAFLAGTRAEWLPGVHWESLLERPLEEVRAQLRVKPVSYVPLRTRELRRAA